MPRTDDYSTQKRHKQKLSNLISDAQEILNQIAQNPIYINILEEGSPPPVKVDSMVRSLEYLEDEI